VFYTLSDAEEMILVISEQARLKNVVGRWSVVVTRSLANAR